MKLLSAFFLFAFVAFAYALTVEEAWETYKANPLKAENPEWVEKVENFETFKSQWDEAKAYNGKYKTTEDAWVGYKEKFGKSYTSEENTKRYIIFKTKWEENVQHNEKYARGDIYYPIWADPSFDETEEELQERIRRPQH